MTREAYLSPEGLKRWTQDLLAKLEQTPGRRRFPELDEKAAFIWLDPQKIFISPQSPAYLPAWEAVRENCYLLLMHAKKCGRLSVITRHLHPPSDNGGTIALFFGRLLRGDDPLSLVDERLLGALEDGTILFEKQRHSAFSCAPLREELRKRGIGTVILAGVQAHLCVLATAVEAGTLDFVPVVVADAIAAARERQHCGTLELLSSGLAFVMTTKEILERWR